MLVGIQLGSGQLLSPILSQDQRSQVTVPPPPPVSTQLSLALYKLLAPKVGESQSPREQVHSGQALAGGHPQQDEELLWDDQPLSAGAGLGLLGKPPGSGQPLSSL